MTLDEIFIRPNQLKNIHKDRRHDHYWIENGVLYESYRTIRWLRWRGLCNVRGMPDMDRCSEACIINIEKKINNGMLTLKNVDSSQPSTKDTIEADQNALRIYLKMGYSKKTAFAEFCKLFGTPNTKEHKSRYKKIKKFIGNFDINAGGPRETTMPIPGLKNQQAKLGAAVKTVTAELKSDKAFREAWSANIAMAFKDNYGQYKKKTGKTVINKEDLHIIANEAAEYFLQLLCDEIKYPDGR